MIKQPAFVLVWQENAWYRTYIAADGTGRHADIRIGMYAEYVNPVHDLTTVKGMKVRGTK